ncbi:MAG: Rieske (2Fe-2S) protein [Thalassobaculaceae bacterium]|nr:Rieske (2Fe-2S) protein [Thalassobaculaceae bacterium]
MSITALNPTDAPQSDAVSAANGEPVWVEALPLAGLRSKGRALVKRGGRQIALFMTSGGVRAIANRCPHQGYPLSQGSLSDGEACTLTCNWHNWKFDLATGAVIGGGDAVRVFPVALRDDMVWVDIAEAPAADRVARALTGLHDGFRERQDDRIARDLARIEAAGTDPRLGVRAAIRWTHDRFRWGMSHAHAALPDWLALADEQEDPVDRLVCFTEIVAHLADDSLREDAYPFADGVEDWDEDAFVAAVEAEDEDRAIRIARGGLAAGGWERIDRGLCRAALAHYQDFGHSVIYVEKTAEAVRRLDVANDPDAAADGSVAEPLLLLLVRALVVGQREDLIPEFKAYRPARDAWTGRGRTPVKPADLCRVSVAKALERVSASSADPGRCYDALLAAAAWQLLHADPVYATRAEQPVSQNVGRLDFSHAITFANAGRRMTHRYPELAADMLLQLACFLGRNSGYVDPAHPAENWRVGDPAAFVARCAAAVIDHGNPEFIVSAHLVKMTCAVREEIAAAPHACWVPDVAAALNRFLNEPFKRKLTRRVAHQARETVKGE